MAKILLYGAYPEGYFEYPDRSQLYAAASPEGDFDIYPGAWQEVAALLVSATVQPIEESPSTSLPKEQ